MIIRVDPEPEDNVDLSMLSGNFFTTETPPCLLESDIKTLAMRNLFNRNHDELDDLVECEILDGKESETITGGFRSTDWHKTAPKPGSYLPTLVDVHFEDGAYFVSKPDSISEVKSIRKNGEYPADKTTGDEDWKHRYGKQYRLEDIGFKSELYFPKRGSFGTGFRRIHDSDPSLIKRVTSVVLEDEERTEFDPDQYPITNESLTFDKWLASKDDLQVEVEVESVLDSVTKLLNRCRSLFGRLKPKGQ